MERRLHSEDSRELRARLGCFATGVTIVTTRNHDGAPVGVTANSFTSVSLDPPLVLVSLSRNLLSISAFEKARKFAISVLGSEQAGFAKRFGARGVEKWADCESGSGANESPVIPGAIARFECETHSIIPIEDHNLHIGRVMYSTGAPHENPLIFHAGKFTSVSAHALL